MRGRRHRGRAWLLRALLFGWPGFAQAREPAAAVGGRASALAPPHPASGFARPPFALPSWRAWHARALADFDDSRLELTLTFPSAPSYLPPPPAVGQAGGLRSPTVDLLVRGYRGQAGVETWEGVHLFYARPFGARLVRSVMLGKTHIRCYVAGEYSPGDPVIAAGWSFRFAFAL
jgi:hypothetical protein